MNRMREGNKILKNRGKSITKANFKRKLKPLTKKDLEYIKQEMGNNKKTLHEFNETIYHTLTFFPELKNTHITFKFQNINTTLNARPTIISLLFKKKESRRYVVRINNSTKRNTVALSKVSYNAQIGVLAHEFSHFIDYSEKGIWGIFKRLVSYTNKRAKKKFEHEIDQMTIERGLGWPLYDWAHTVLYDSNAGAKYKKLKEEIYLTPTKIIDYLTSVNQELVSHIH